MKKTHALLINAVCCGVVFMMLSGCGNPPPPAKSAKNEIRTATEAMDTAQAMAAKKSYDRAMTEYDRALEAISKGESFAQGTELTQLTSMKREARSKRIDMENKALMAPPPPKKTAATEVAKAEDPEAARKKAAEAEAARVAAANKKAESEILNVAKPAVKPKPDEPEEVEVKKKPEEKKPEEVADPAKPKKDKSGIFNEVTDKSPPLEIAKVERIGRFTLAYCQLHNNTDNGRRITVAAFFKDNDNQILLKPPATVSFPFERFSTKVKDLIGDQSVRNLTPNTEEVPGHQYLQFVCVGESTAEDLAKKVAKVYVNVLFNDGKQVEATSVPTMANEVDNALKGLMPKTPAAPKK